MDRRAACYGGIYIYNLFQNIRGILHLITLSMLLVMHIKSIFIYTIIIIININVAIAVVAVALTTEYCQLCKSYHRPLVASSPSVSQLILIPF